MTYETILCEVEGDGVAVITLNRPDVRNAINQQMVDELHAALGSLEDRDDVKALILTAAGGKAFMSGADIAELRERREADALKGINANLFARFERFPRPTVAAIVGWCLGGGCELALTCDFRIAGTSSGSVSPKSAWGSWPPRVQRAACLRWSACVMRAGSCSRVPSSMPRRAPRSVWSMRSSRTKRSWTRRVRGSRRS